VSAGAVAASYVDVAAAAGTASLTLSLTGQVVREASGTAALTLGATGTTGPSWATYIAALTPTGWWRLGEPSGTTATDSSGNSRNGTYTSTTLAAVGAVAGSDTAATFNGSTSRMNVAGGAHWPKPNQDWSVACFIKYTTTALTMPLAIRENGGTGASVTMYFLTGRASAGSTLLSLETWDTNTPANRCDSLAAVNNGAYHFAVATFNNTSRALKLYVDGVLQSTKTQSSTFNTTDRVVGVGYNPNGTGVQFFPGTVDEVVVKAGVEWTATQVAEMYSSRLVP